MADSESQQPQESSPTAAHVSVHSIHDQFEPMATYDLDRLSQAFETSARRWELIVYPSMFAFIILAAYGFYLVFSLAKDMHYMSISVDTNMTKLSNNMQSMADNMGQLTSNVRYMTLQVESMAQNVETLKPLLASIRKMDQSMQSITFAIHNIRSDTASITNSVGQGIGRPMSFMNNFAPW
ncbi:hypothetical protein TI04_06440 [Achromatium sp. WMS2]|nr:hypothetical protein TI04_06440 [Achromatium sp. WMS2]